MNKKGFYRKKPVEIEAWEFTKEALGSNDSWVRLYRNELHLISQYAGEDNQIYYSYMDPQFGFEGGCRTTSKDKFLKHFVFMQLGRY